MVAHVRLIAAVVVAGWLGAPARGAAAAPPAAQAAGEVVKLGRGVVEFASPGWAVMKATEASVLYHSGESMISLALLPAETKLTEGYGAAVVKILRENAQRNGVEIVVGPRIETDGRFAVVIMKQSQVRGRATEQWSYYRAVGPRVVTASCNAPAGDAAEVARVRELAANVLLSAGTQGKAGALPGGGGGVVKSPAGTRPAEVVKAPAVPPREAQTAVLTKVKLQVTPPAGWTGMVTDVESGAVATYRDAADRERVIVVSVAAAPADPRARAALFDKMAAQDRAALKLEGAVTVRAPAAAAGPAKLARKVRGVFDYRGGRVAFESRQVVVGATVVSVGSLAPAAAMEEVSGLADGVAVSVEGIGGK